MCKMHCLPRYFKIWIIMFYAFIRKLMTVPKGTYYQKQICSFMPWTKTNQYWKEKYVYVFFLFANKLLHNDKINIIWPVKYIQLIVKWKIIKITKQSQSCQHIVWRKNYLFTCKATLSLISQISHLIRGCIRGQK